MRPPPPSRLEMVNRYFSVDLCETRSLIKLHFHFSFIRFGFFYFCKCEENENLFPQNSGWRTCRSCRINMLLPRCTPVTGWTPPGCCSRSPPGPSWCVLMISCCTCFGFYYKYFDPVNPTICSPVANKNYQLLKIYQMLNWKYQTSWNTTNTNRIAKYLTE